MTEDRRKEFWDRLEDIRAGMLEVGGAFLPMSHNIEPEDGNLWFITARGTAMAQAAGQQAETRYIVSDNSESLYAEIRGRLDVSQDRQKLDEVWNAVASTWFEEGKDDPDLVLVRMTPRSAEVWLGPASGMSFLFEMVKAKVKGDKPDYGDQFSLKFS
ncbi:General stress protein 26 [Paracoccus thiocyanatus]|uniref:General stress protein 26 n=1 Tax=Paracoccus thiocyanatus TaxID=34006 RepID=A0A1N6UVG4_9RHOB|nr:pyridoxamine 5'-phosphate oxidase family protein [Paracoccus thiocyanatus]SIQ69655.1 General stress protein 26 [Paracoccus thiocyanatus]